MSVIFNSASPYSPVSSSSSAASSSTASSSPSILNHEANDHDLPSHSSQKRRVLVGSGIIEIKPLKSQSNDKFLTEMVECLFSNQSFWTEMLKSHQGCWFYKMVGFDVKLAMDLLFFHPTKDFDNEEMFDHFFNLCDWKSRIWNITDVVYSGHTPTYNPYTANELQKLTDKFKEFPFLKELLPTLVKLKIQELKGFITNDKNRDCMMTVENIPCLVIYKQNRFEALRALFYHGQLMGLIADEEGKVLTELKNKGFMDIIANDGKGGVKGFMTIDHINNLNTALASDIPPLLVINLISPPFQQRMLQTEEKRGMKRSRVEKEATETEPPRKKPKTAPDPLNALPSLFPIPLRLQLPQPSSDEFSSDLFWKSLSLKNIAKLSNKLIRRQTRKAIFQETPYPYPILDLLEKPMEKLPFTPLHPFLKSYQIQEVDTQLSLFKKGVSRLLAFEMGLGKTYVMAEILAQLIFRGLTGTFIFVAPQPITVQMVDELRSYLALVISIAWTDRFNQATEDERPNLLLEAKNLIIESLKNHSSETFFSLLPLFSFLSADELYSILFERGAFNETYFPFWEKGQKLAEKMIEEKEPILFEVPNSFVLFSQLSKASEQIYQFYQQKQIKIPSLEDYPNGLDNLIHFCLADIKIATCVSGIKESLSRGKDVLVTHYEAFVKIPDEMMAESSIAALFIDEAQKIHTSKANRSKIFLQLTSAAKRKNPHLSLLISTATPLENNFSEPWTLLKIANPLDDSFKKGTFEFLQSKMTNLQNLLNERIEQQGNDEEEEETENAQEVLFKCMVLTFSHLEAFRQKILTSLLGRKEREDADVKASWQDRAPQKTHLILPAKLTRAASMAFKQIHEDFKNKSFGFFEYKHKVQLIQLHPELKDSSFEGEDRKMKKVERRFDKKEVKKTKKWIKNSPLVGNLTRSQPFKEMIRNRQKGLVYVDHIKTASLVKKAIETFSSRNNFIQAALFTGEAIPKEKEKLLKWFKEPYQGTRVLVTTKKTGSLGLNLPQATYVFFPAGADLNPSVDDQAAARAVRMNSTGLKTIVSFQYNIFMHTLTQAIKEEKNCMVKFFHVHPSRGIREQFKTFTELLTAHFFHAILINCKNHQYAMDTKKLYQALLNEIVDEIDDELLEISLQSVMPKASRPLQSN